jgi:phospholysine phosphohistidine inorganic pyrophosphate phosphatase
LPPCKWLSTHASGPVSLFVPPATAGEFEPLEIATAGSDVPVGAVVVGDYAEHWSFAELNRAFRLLMAEPPPVLVALGMTRYWRAPDGLRLDTAPFVAALAHATGIEPVVLGKPGAAFFEAALARLSVPASAAMMIGDDIRADIGGAQAQGIRGLLVRTGKFRPSDLDGDVEPYDVLASIADLPEWWRTRSAGDG